MIKKSLPRMTRIKHECTRITTRENRQAGFYPKPDEPEPKQFESREPEKHQPRINTDRHG